MTESSRQADVASTAPAAPSSGASAPDGDRSGLVNDVSRGKQSVEFKPVALDEAGNAQPVAEAVGRKIIRNAEIAIEVEAPDETQVRLGTMAEQLGGFVVTTETVNYGNSARVTITMRVPAERFNEATNTIRAAGSRVLSDKSTGQDVTEEFIDLQARIRTKQALETQFLEIMKQARTVEDALEVQRQIAEVRGEIERFQGRMRFLENQSSLSTIKITLSAPTPVIASNGPTFGTHIQRAFGDAISTGEAIIIGFIRFLGVMTPVAVLIGIPGFLLLRFLWRRMRRRMAARPVEAQ